MSVIIISHFTDNGLPKIGLLPTIRIRKVSNGDLIITDADLSELGDGSYKYIFSTFNPSIEYIFRVDGTNMLSNIDRYQYATNDSYNDDIRQEFNNNKDLIKNSKTRFTEKLYNNSGDSVVRTTIISTDGTTETRRKI